jgi:primosomal protein N' (replication factor Y)
VVVSNATRAFDREYDYVVPEGLAGRAKPGMRAFAPFGARNAARVAIIVAVRGGPGALPPEGESLLPEGDSLLPKGGSMLPEQGILPPERGASLAGSGLPPAETGGRIEAGGSGGAPGAWHGAMKALLSLPDSEPLLDSRDFALAAHMRDKYMCTWFEALSCMLPKGWDREADGASGRTVMGVRLAAGPGAVRDAIDAGRIARAQQIRVLEYMLAAGCEPAQGEQSGQAGEWAGAPKQGGPAGAVGQLALGQLDEPTGGPEQGGQAGASGQSGEWAAHGAQAGAHGQLDEQAGASDPPAATGESVPAALGESAPAAPGELAARPATVPARPAAVPVRDAAAEAGVSAGVVDTLVRAGWLERASIAVDRRPGRGRRCAAPGASEAPVPSAEQARALEYASERLEAREFSEILLHGVTGSGKTEVYMRLAAQALAMGRQAIVLVPEISLTPQMADRFRARFGKLVAIFHSRLSDGERGDEWRRVRSGGAAIAVGARSAVFAPFRDIGLVVIDEEHESSYKSEMSPRYHAGEIARFRCREHGALLMYGSATPSVDTYFLAEQGKIRLLEMTGRANSSRLPDVTVTDMRDELRSGNRSIFGRPLEAAIRESLAAKKQAILFMNRRGYASFMLCRDCGYIVTCRECSVSYTYHQDRNRLVCHYCGLTAPVPSACPACGGGSVRQFGMGTERVEEEVRKAFAGCTVIRMDRDTTSGKDGHAKVLDEFARKKIDILIGTQMIAKGHDFPDVTLVGVLAADSILNFNDYRAAERAFQLLTQVSGRSGRGAAPGRAIIQTYNPDHYSVRMAREHDYKGFYRQEIIARRELLYPPFNAIGAILASGRDDAATRRAAEALCGRIGAIGAARGETALTVLAPMRPPIAKVREKYRWRSILKHPDAEALESLIREALDGCLGGRELKNVDVSIDINPFSMM